MTKLNNKGVSLIDCLIAIAVLALLVSPIISQLYTTVQVSAKAKEEQYVIEAANDSYEYFRKADDNELTTGSGRATLIAEGDHDCNLCDSSGNPINYMGELPVGTKKAASVNSVNPLNVNYHYKIYAIKVDEDGDGTADNQFGRSNTAYDRYVVWSDLKNKIYELGYQVDYDATSVTGGSFTKRSDNAYVHAGDGSSLPSMDPDLYNMLVANPVYNDALIEDIVVEERTNLAINDINKDYIKELKDPNDITLGNVQDIDSTKVAIIPGEATLLDHELEKELRKDIMNFGASNSTSYIYNDLENADALYGDIKDILEGANTKKSRLIHIEITCGKTASGALDLDANGVPNKYHVNCDVSYCLDFGGDDLKLFDGGTSVKSTADDFKYRVLENDYYTDTPPDVYFVYEPLLNRTAIGAGKIVNYAMDDFITITTDKYTSGKDPHTDGEASRIYLIKSTENFSKVAADNGSERFSDVYEAMDDTTKAKYDPTAFYTVVNGNYIPVNINITRDVVTGLESEQGMLDIYTNISKKNLPTEYEKQSASTIDTTLHENTSKFSVSVKTSNEYPVRPMYAQGTLMDYDMSHIIKVEDEEGSDDMDRLAQFTVVYQADDKNVIYITGARGADR